MVRFISFFTMAIVAIMLNAQPLLVGHRGSYWGVENTSEAFINGAKKGYHYLECDVKVAGDGTLVLSHDDTTERLGGSRTIASSTITQLKAETYTQTRGGVTYTGTICTLAEYLDICKEYNVLPVIELKWATGINSNDCSGIPALIKAIEEKGFRNSCVILTSMKPCLEYINEKYPDVTLQFLTGQYWANHFDWCVERGIDVDIQVGYFDKSTVQKYHDAGLKVNIWTANTNANYETYGNYGCDFITTDYLDPANLPELDSEITFPPNTADYPKNEAIVRGYYETEEVAKFNIPDVLKNHTIKRALIQNSQWYILSNDNTGKSYINIIDPETGEITAEINVAGLNLSDMAFTADGVLLACNYADIANAESWNIYKWNSDTSAPTVLCSINDNTQINGQYSQIGQSFTTSGRFNDLKVFTSVSSEDGVSDILGLQLNKGIISKSVYTTASFNSSLLTLHNSPFSRDNIIIGSNSYPQEYTIDWDDSKIVPYSSFNDGYINSTVTGLSFFRYGTKVYAYIANCSPSMTHAEASIYDITKGLSEAEINSQPCPSYIGDSVIKYMATDVEIIDGNIILYTFISNGCISKYIFISDYTEGNTGETDFIIEPIWENSINKGDKPENIDGTNAQQGAAYKGMFYVNNYVEERLYFFNNAGCLGHIPGGQGIGIACDDAGNIIIRNDRLSGTEHSFLIYPAGTTLNNYSEPVSIVVSVPLEGQTNFISASGDVLGERGYIYMYPNKQTAANIITLAYGGIMKSTATEELALKGTAAAYIAPINNNSENWLYQVRANGYYMYNGGENIELLVGRSSTTAPARNTTGGGDYFRLSNHDLLVHSSGTNYTGGFSIRDITTNTVITSIDPIGTMGYSADGNFSTFNWLYAEKIDAGSYYIYLYCPANGMAVYRLRDKNYVSDGIEDNFIDYVTVANVYPNPTTDILNIFAPNDIENISVFNIMGKMMNIDIIQIDGAEAQINVSQLPKGVYLLTLGNGNQTVKFIKK